MTISNGEKIRINWKLLGNSKSALVRDLRDSFIFQSHLTTGLNSFTSGLLH